ncbi:MAG: hypothetical protein HYX20_02220 [Candidatus Yanofskybacteria bacterium]|nr:hypothetical protein [Candidatus Yanofskybacteria bacterium]
MEIREIFEELIQIKQETYRGKARNIQIGEHKSPLQGAGYDLLDITKWRHGDSVDNIDWQLSLLSWPKKIYKLEHPEFKSTPVILVVDISPSIFVEIDQKANKFRLLLHLIGALGFAANYFHDPVGILCVSDGIEFYLPPKFGSGQIFYAVKLAVEKAEEFEILKKKNKFGRRRSNLSAALELLAARLKRHCSIVILSDFIDVTSGQSEINYQMLEFLSAKHNWNVIAVFLDDPNEFLWQRGRGTVAVRDAETGVIQKIKADRAADVRRTFLKKTEELREKLGRSGVDSVVLNFSDHFNNLAQFLSQRKSVRR